MASDPALKVSPKAARWLGFLAEHLRTADHTGLAWWRLDEAITSADWHETRPATPPAPSRLPAQLNLRLKGRGRQLLRDLRWGLVSTLVTIAIFLGLQVLPGFVIGLFGQAAARPRSSRWSASSS